VKLILTILCAVLVGSPAFAADLELKCRGSLVEKGPVARPIELVVSVSDGEVRLRADPKYDLGASRLILKKSDATTLKFESVERTKRPGYEARALIDGQFFRASGSVHVYWMDDETRYLSARCEFLLGARSAILPKVT
jgi:hypothetical protein